LNSVRDWTNGTTAFSYDDAGQLIQILYPNGVREEMTYDVNGRVIATLVRKNGTTQKFDTVADTSVTRNAAGRIVSVDRKLIPMPDPPSGFNGYYYDAAHQVQGVKYDDMGRVTADNIRQYKWDLAGRLISYTGGDGAASFTYDAFGQRISKTTGNTTLNYVLNYALPFPAISIIRNGDVDQRYFVWLPNGKLLATITADGVRRFYHFDETGSTSFMEDEKANISDTYTVTPFGETVVHTGPLDQPFTFHGMLGAMQEDNTGLYYMRSRYYDAVTGRFLSPDPEASLDPRSINPYQFVYNNPIERWDPMGTHPGECSNLSSITMATLSALGEVAADLTLPCGTDPSVVPAILPAAVRNNDPKAPEAIFNIGFGTPVKTFSLPFSGTWSGDGEMHQTGGQLRTEPVIPHFQNSRKTLNPFPATNVPVPLILPYVASQQFADTGFAPSGAAGQFGYAGKGNCQPRVYGTGTLGIAQPGAVFPSVSLSATSLNLFGVNPVPMFQGLVSPQCGFSNAPGFAYATDGASLDLARTYLDLILDSPLNLGSNGEAVGR
jgi:RHS repeat-associated protein